MVKDGRRKGCLHGFNNSEDAKQDLIIMTGITLALFKLHVL